MGIQNPLDTAQRVHSILVAATGYLTSSLININDTFDLPLRGLTRAGLMMSCFLLPDGVKETH